VIEPNFLSLEEVLAPHADQLERYGGAAGIRPWTARVRRRNVETPKATCDGEFLHDGLFAMAAAYAFHIAESQAFVDGNKRAALNAAQTGSGTPNSAVPDRAISAIQTRSTVAHPTAEKCVHLARALLETERGKRVSDTAVRNVCG